MDTNSNKLENDDKNMYEMKKNTYWEKYGVKRFHYRGRRRYTPLVYQSGDGGMIISNDVFGLTIRQFERTYNSCLDRRKTHEQWILNLRYPDKSSNEYLEYLQNCTDCGKEHLFLDEKDFKQTELVRHLIKTVGIEIDIRNRQRLFIIQDMIDDVVISKSKQILSGSLAEGLNLPSSDLDIMFVTKDIDVIENLRNIKHTLQRTTLVMETDTVHPGFARLSLLPRRQGESDLSESIRNNRYLSVKEFLNVLSNQYRGFKFVQHGPCLSDKNQNFDFAFCLRSKYLPYIAVPWSWRYRHQWPPNYVINKIKNNGCLLVPIGPKNVSNCNFLWRLSFSVAEKHLVHSFNFTQLLCYGLLKLTLKHIVNTNDHAKDLLCSYFLKTALFWVSEEVDIDTFKLSKLFFCFSLCLNKLISWVKNCHCPNYFIPENNMFLGKITLDNNRILLHVLDSLQLSGIDGLINTLFPRRNRNDRLLYSNSETSFIMQDFLFYRICELYHSTDISHCYKVRTIIECLLKSESSSFIIAVCKHYYAKSSQNAVQLLPLPTTCTCKKYNIHKLYHRLLQEGIKTDAVSGWLLYASFYYVTGQFSVTLKLTDYVLSTCSPDMINITCDEYSEDQKNSYRHNVHSTMTLNEKIKKASVDNVLYIKQSSLIPKELQREVEDSNINISPVVMSHCLRFLCYHHLGDVFNRQQAFHDLISPGISKSLNKGLDLKYLKLFDLCHDISCPKGAACMCRQLSSKLVR